MLSNIDNLQTELQRANTLLAEAKDLLKKGHAFRAKQYATLARKLAKRFERLRDKLLEYISETERMLWEIYQTGTNVTGAQDLLDRAKFALIAGEYDNALSFIEQSRYVARRSQFKPFPLFEKDVKIKTIIGFERNKILYKVRLENDTTENLGEVCVTPFVPGELFDLDRNELIVGPFKPNSALTCEFVLTPKVRDWSLVTAGTLIQGRDVTIKTIMSTVKGLGMYKVRIDNNRDNPLTDVKIFPTLPDWLYSDDDEQTIPIIHPHDSESVEFTFKRKVWKKTALPTKKVKKDVLDEKEPIKQEPVQEEPPGEPGAIEPSPDVDFDSAIDAELEKIFEPSFEEELEVEALPETTRDLDGEEEQDVYEIEPFDDRGDAVDAKVLSTVEAVDQSEIIHEKKQQKKKKTKR